MDLLEMLATLVTDEGLSVALIVGRDGLLVEGQGRSSIMDLEALAAMTTRALLEMERLGRQLAGGNLSQVRLRLDSYQLLIETITASDILVVGIESSGSGERLLDAVARYRPQIQQILNGL